MYRNVFITGAASGLGNTIATKYLTEGFQVFAFDINAEGLDSWKHSLAKSSQEKMKTYIGDVRNRSEIQQAVIQAVAWMGKIEILANIAGIAYEEHFLKITPEHWREIIDINLTGMFNVGQIVAKSMAESGGGSIINMASKNGIQAEVNYAHYNTSKSGVVMLTKSIFAPAKTTQDSLISMGIDNTIFEYFYGIDVNLFNDSISPIISKAQDRIKVLYAGRISPDKQIDTLLAVFAYIRKYLKNVDFIIVGGGEQDLEQKIKNEAELYGDITFVGRVKHESLNAYYTSADIFITASNRENYPLTLIEAMACGLPVVAPRAGGLIEMLEHGVNGFLTDPHDISAMGEAVIKIARDKELRLSMREKAIEIGSRQSYQLGVDKLLSAWQQIISKKKQLPALEYEHD